MNAEKVLKRLYTFFMGFGIFIFIGSLVELTALRHFNEELQFVPFVLCGLGIILAALMLIKPTAGMQMLLNFGMWVIAAGGIVVPLFMYQEILRNYWKAGGPRLSAK